MNSDFLKAASYEESPAFVRFLNYSKGKRMTSDAVIRLLNPKEHWCFLDVGGGTGDITIPIAELVGKTVIVEPSSRMINEFKKNLKSSDNLEIIQKKVEDTNFKDKFDLILVAHVLYFIDDWDTLFDKLVSCLNSGGYLVIVMHARSGMFFNFLNKFQRLINKDIKILTYKDVVRALKKRNLRPKHKIIKYDIVIPDVDEALNLSHFFFEKPVDSLDDNIKGQLLKYFRCHREGQKVVLTSKQAIVWIKK